MKQWRRYQVDGPLGDVRLQKQGTALGCRAASISRMRAFLSLANGA
jgi:hypothetical protein